MSVGAIVALAACFATKLAQDGSGVPVIVAILVGLITGVACGAFSGLFIAIANIPAFIATLATCTIAVVLYLYLQMDDRLQVFLMLTNIWDVLPGDRFR